MSVITNLFASLPPETAAILGTWVAALLTLAVLSYLFGENPLFRVAEHLFVGLAAGYALSMAWNSVLWPRLLQFMADPRAYWHYGAFFALGIMLLARGSQRLSVLGNLPLGVLFGTGAALALGGALTGSLVPHMQAAVVSLAPTHYAPGALGWAYVVDALLLLLGTLAVFSVFHFSRGGRDRLAAFWQGPLRVLGVAGRGVLMMTFGALLAGAVLSFFAMLNSRLLFLINDWGSLFGKMGL